MRRLKTDLKVCAQITQFIAGWLFKKGRAITKVAVPVFATALGATTPLANTKFAVARPNGLSDEQAREINASLDGLRKKLSPEHKYWGWVPFIGGDQALVRPSYEGSETNRYKNYAPIYRDYLNRGQNISIEVALRSCAERNYNKELHQVETSYLGKGVVYGRQLLVYGGGNPTCLQLLEAKKNDTTSFVLASHKTSESGLWGGSASDFDKAYNAWKALEKEGIKGIYPEYLLQMLAQHNEANDAVNHYNMSQAVNSTISEHICVIQKHVQKVFPEITNGELVNAFNNTANCVESGNFLDD